MSAQELENEPASGNTEHGAPLLVRLTAAFSSPLTACPGDSKSSL